MLRHWFILRFYNIFKLANARATWHLKKHCNYFSIQNLISISVALKTYQIPDKRSPAICCGHFIYMTLYDVCLAEVRFAYITTHHHICDIFCLQNAAFLLLQSKPSLKKKECTRFLVRMTDH